MGDLPGPAKEKGPKGSGSESTDAKKEVEAEERVIVGVNKYVTPYAKIKGILRVDSAEAKKQITGLNKVKKERNAADVAASLENLKKVARSSENTMPAFIRCVEACATVGEICGALREVFGVQRESLIF